ncbi:DUF2239 family protein [Janthinobacterium aquaticum]|uniref:DUF2239 family protein n=1 Tax=Janthinobacterium sp. FT58W TaxID=2654254 RepID=UPI0012659671|nr:DUF2239 family protein [Janthinobacterium sp. FT58W]KAB8041786.1 DUF2239 family protein [Janthinobacterium sp. FT58W]
MSDTHAVSLTAFAGKQKIATGTLHALAPLLKERVTREPEAQILIFNDDNGKQVDLNLHGSLAEVLQRLPAPRPVDADTVSTPRTAGRPKLGVTAREVTLLPRHWEWLAGQPGGASVALRKLVEQAQRDNRDIDQQRQARDAAYQFMSALAGDEAGFEEASRALFAGRRDDFLRQVQAWPDDVREHVSRLADKSWPAST